MFNRLYGLALWGMVEGTDPSAAGTQVAWTCPRCGAPLPLPGKDGFVTCDFCRVRTEVASLALPRPVAPAPVETASPLEPPFQLTEDDSGEGSHSFIVRVIAIVAIVVVLGVIVASQPQSGSAGVPEAPHCSVTINASSTSGPAPFTATFTAEVTAPPGDFTSVPEWQFGPFGTGIDLNYTYGSTVSHTWDSSGSFGVHVSVPDSSGQGCWTTMSVNVT